MRQKYTDPGGEKGNLKAEADQLVRDIKRQTLTRPFSRNQNNRGFDKDNNVAP